MIYAVAQRQVAHLSISVQALCTHLDWLEKTYAQRIELCVATGYFNPEGFALLADRLERLKSVRLLLGAEPVPPPVKPIRMPGDPFGPRFEEKLVRKELDRQQEGLERDRNLIDFAPGTMSTERFAKGNRLSTTLATAIS